MNHPTIDDIRAGKYLVLASCSGGKDSSALSMWLREQGISHDRIFADTGWESPILYQYLRGPLTEKLGPILEVGYPGGMEALIRKKNMFPSRLRRYCTTELKVKPIQAHIAALQDAGHEVINAVGIRRDESTARAEWPEWEWQPDFDCWKWAPLVEWTFEDVRAIHERHNLLPCPLYLEGASRVGCFPCIYAGKHDLRLVARLDPDRIDLIEVLETDLSARAKERLEARGEKLLFPMAFFQDSKPVEVDVTCDCGMDPECLVCSGSGLLRALKYPSLPIRQAVEWSSTSHGGRQVELFWQQQGHGGCMRWGLCGV